MPRPAACRVLMTADAVGGVWVYALELASGLARHGTEVLLAVMGPSPGAAQRAAALGIPGLILEERPYRLEWMADAGRDLQLAGEWLLALERRFRPDVVHLNGYGHAVLPWSAPTVVVAHSCVPTWWQAVKGGDVPDSFRDYRLSVVRGLAAATKVVVPTAAHLAAMRRHYGALPGARVIYNGRDTGAFAPGRKTALVLGAGRVWDEGKNLAALAAVAPLLDWPVHILGPGRASTDVAAGARYLGPLPAAAVAEHLACAAVFVAPARYEPFGLAVLEAALSECALVLGDIPTFRELWAGAAIFVPPDDHTALRQAIAELIAAPERRRTLAVQARRRALGYGAAAMTDAYLDLYRSVTSAPVRSAAGPQTLAI